MPISTSTTFSIESYRSPSLFPPRVWEAFKSHERDANIMLPHAIKCMEEQSDNQLWITCSTPQSSTSQSVDFVLSCTEGSLGNYPIFIFTTIPSHILHDTYVRPRIAKLARELRKLVPMERVFSIFGPEPITCAFVDSWTALTGVGLAPNPDYYAATFTHCTKHTFMNRRMTYMEGLYFNIRPSVESDIPAVARLCKAFAATSEPFVLSDEQALQEAQHLIRHRQLWVHEISRGEQQRAEIASIVAFTRVSGKVAAITKVYTNPDWRKRGCAERLVRKVTGHLLKSKESVVLYVSHGNPAAKVYSKVGFVGLRDNAQNYEGVDRWLEIGFDPKATWLGHW